MIMSEGAATSIRSRGYNSHGYTDRVEEEKKLRPEMDAALQKALAEKSINPVVGRAFRDLSETEKAHEEVIGHAEGTAGRIVVYPREEDFLAELPAGSNSAGGLPSGKEEL